MLQILKKTLLWCVLIIVVLISSFMLYVRFFPVNLKPIAEKTLSIVLPDLDIQFDELLFTYTTKFTLIAKNVAFEHMDNTGGIEEVQLRLANRSLFFLRPSPKHIVISGVHYEGEYEPSSQDQALNLTAQLKPFLARLKYLKTIQMNNINILIREPDNTYFALKEGAGIGTFYINDGLNLKITGQLVQDDKALSPITIIAQTQDHRTVFNAALNAVNVRWFKPYLPANMRDNLKGNMSLNVATTWMSKQGWAPLQIVSHIQDLHFVAPLLYQEPHHFSGVDFSGRYYLKEDRLDNIKLSLQEGDFELKLSGKIKNLKSEQNLKLEGSVNGRTEADIFAHLPSARMKRTLPWLKENITGTLLNPVRFSLEGEAKSLVRCTPNIACPGVNLKAYFSPESNIQPLKNVPKLVATTSSTLTLSNGLLRVYIPSAVMGQHTVKEVSATIANIQTHPDTPRMLNLTARLSGPNAEILPVVQDIFKLPQTYQFSGKNDTQFSLTLPFKRGQPPSVEEATVDVKSKVSQASLTGGLKEHPLIVTTGELHFNNAQITFKGQGRYAKTPFNLTYKRYNKTKEESGKIIAKAEVGHLPFTLPNFLNLSGNAPTHLTFKRAGKDKSFSLDLTSDLTHTVAEIPKLNWQHIAGQPLKLTLQGTWQDDALNADLFTLIGSNTQNKTEIAGSFYYPKSGQNMTLQASPFILGNTNANMEFRNNALSINGNSLDLTRALTVTSNSKFTYPEQIQAHIKLNRLFLKQGFVQNLDISASREKNHWEDLSVTAQHSNGTPFKLTYTPTEKEEYQLNLDAPQFGSLISTIGLTDKMRGGYLAGKLTLDKERNGSGEFTLKDTKMVNAPVLVQLISLLSLDELLSGNEGIAFQEGLFPIIKTGGSIKLQNAHLSGPSMALKFSGEIIPTDHYINIDGQFIPTAGINRIINKIPLVGDILTGSQDGVIVSDFKVKGNWAKPETTVKPLSTITPGIIKDFFNILKGGDE